MRKRKLTPDERRELDKLIEEGRRAREYMHHVIDKIDAMLAARRARPQNG